MKNVLSRLNNKPDILLPSLTAKKSVKLEFEVSHHQVQTQRNSVVSSEILIQFICQKISQNLTLQWELHL